MKKNKLFNKYPIRFIGSLLFLALLFIVSNQPVFKERNPDGDYDDKNKIAMFHGDRFIVPGEIPYKTDVLGSHKNGGEKRIEIDLSHQKLYAYEGDKQVYSFDVSTGKWGLTPTGDFRIYTKLKYTLMAGGNKAIGTYYYLPNVPFTQYFYRDFGLHGTYWHHNFGHPMSHGCVNMRTEDAEKLFYWTNPPENGGGTRVVIYGTTPKD
jgi:lipoprotein-anchoring transpeptidase ErfK/SrfK